MTEPLLLPSFPPMALALQQATAAAARHEVPVGAVVVRDGVVIAQAGNRVEELCDASAHAELLALRAAAQSLGSPRLPGCDLYVTLEPCALCAAAISFFRIRRLYFGAYDPKGGGVDHGPRLFSQPTIHHAPEVYGGIAESQCTKLLKAFFREMRYTKSSNGQGDHHA
jgi:tRNA(Arg) A34 adenosine deaminase TadA